VDQVEKLSWEEYKRGCLGSADVANMVAPRTFFMVYSRDARPVHLIITMIK